jgi:hypothetical protein
LCKGRVLFTSIHVQEMLVTIGHMEEMEWSVVCSTGVFVNYGIKYCVQFYCTFIVNLVIYFNLFMDVFFFPLYLIVYL